MNKVFRYELRRLVCSKFFLILLAVVLWYGSQLLNTVTVLGVANTAPFSPWSFGSYLSQLTPLLGMALLFFLWNQHSGKAQQVKVLTAVTPVRQGRYLLVKCGAAVTAWLLLALALTGMGIVFLFALFGEIPVGEFLLPLIAALLPPLIFLLGIGLLAGRIHPSLLFPLMALALGAGFIPLPLWADLYGQTLFSQYPLKLEMLDPSFSIPAQALWGKAAYLLAGAACTILAVRKGRRRNEA